MTEIPVPEVLDPDRVLPFRTPEELPEHHQRVVAAYHDACEYGRALWHELDELRRYLMDDVARGGQGPVIASASMLRDEQEWQRWADRYAAAHTALCGPHGDHALGRHEARHEAQQHDHLLSDRPARTITP